MRYSDAFIDAAFGDTELEKILSRLRPGDVLPAAELLTALDGESEETLLEAFDHLRIPHWMWPHFPGMPLPAKQPSACVGKPSWFRREAF